MASLKNVPVRIWIILLISLEQFLMMSIMQSLRFSWKLMVAQRNTLRYKPWCILTEEEKIRENAFHIPWYNMTTDDYGPRYDWTVEQKDLILEALIYGQMISSVPGAVLAEFIGPYYVLLYTTAMTAVLNVLRLLFAAIHWKVLLVSEAILGLHLGLVYPSFFVWIARWAPPNERGIFVASKVGSGLAAPFVRIMFRVLKTSIGWRGPFYIITVLTLLYLVMLWFLGCNHPEDHKRIKAKEFNYIKKSQRGKVTSTRSFPPYGSILTSGAFWTLNILHFGSTCSYMYFIHVMSSFLYLFMGIAITTVEFLEIFPYFGYGFVAIVASILADYIRTKNMLDDSDVIKIYAIFSHIIPGCALLIICIPYCYQTIAITLSFIGYACSGCTIISCYRTIIDISPNFAGTVYGLMHLSATSLRVIMPRAIDYIFSINAGIIGWTIVFLIGGGCLVGTGIIFLFFAIGKSQQWNLKSQDRFKLYYYKKPETHEIGESTSGPSNVQETSNKPGTGRKPIGQQVDDKQRDSNQ